MNIFAKHNIDLRWFSNTWAQRMFTATGFYDIIIDS